MIQEAFDFSGSYLPSISRREAINQGLKTYVSARPCRNGNIYYRSVGGRRCLCDKCAEFNKAVDRDHYKKNRNKHLTRARRWKKENSLRYRQLLQNWQKNNRDKINEYARRKRAEDPVRHRDYVKKYIENNPQINRIKFSKRRAAKIQRTPVWSGDLDNFAYAEAASLCFVRGQIHGFEWHVDHSIPLQGREASGLHVAENFQVIPADLNIKKSNRLWYTAELEWLKDAR